MEAMEAWECMAAKVKEVSTHTKAEWTKVSVQYSPVDEQLCFRLRGRVTASPARLELKGKGLLNTVGVPSKYMIRSL